MNPSTISAGPPAQPPAAAAPWRFYRAGGLVKTFSAVRQVAFFTRNAQGFGERWRRRGALAFTALGLPFVYAIHRRFATRLLHVFLRGVSRDRLDLLGEEYFQYVLRPRLDEATTAQIRAALGRGERVVLVSHGLDHVVRPMALHLGVEWVLANRLEFRDGLATGRLLEPVIPPAGVLGFFRGDATSCGETPEACAESLGLRPVPGSLERALANPRREPGFRSHPIVLFHREGGGARLSPRESLRGKTILLVGGTGFIGKVWLASLLADIPDVRKVYLLIRRQRSATALRRFERIIEESPVFDPLHERHGAGLADFLRDRVEVLEGDVTRPNLGLDDATCARLAPGLDLVVNSAGLTDFNPELRVALAANVDGMVYLLDFIRRTDHAALLHLSTCYVVGERDGRVAEELRANYTPGSAPGFDAEQERQSLHATVREIEQRAEGAEVTEELQREALKRTKNLSRDALAAHLKKYRTRWMRAQLVEAGMRRARELGWQNTYCFTKSLGESMIAKFGAELPVAVVRPSITETSTHQPFRGWNEGVNTSAPLSYLLGTFFRQLPSNERKCLDLIPVDLVSRGMTLIAAALVERRHQRVYQLATSACNPCDMRRSIELTCLAHRKHYRAQEGLEHWLRARFDTIPVSKERYQRFSAPRQRRMVRAIRRFSAPIPFVRSPLIRKERDLERLEKLIELYEPFILHNEHVFEAQNVEALSEALPPDEKATFGYDAHAIDWWEYWINIHVPALRRWTYPLIEGRPLESRPRRPFHLDVPSNGGT